MSGEPRTARGVIIHVRNTLTNPTQKEVLQISQDNPLSQSLPLQQHAKVGADLGVGQPDCARWTTLDFLVVINLYTSFRSLPSKDIACDIFLKKTSIRD